MRFVGSVKSGHSPFCFTPSADKTEKINIYSRRMHRPQHHTYNTRVEVQHIINRMLLLHMLQILLLLLLLLLRIEMLLQLLLHIQMMFSVAAADANAGAAAAAVSAVTTELLLLVLLQMLLLLRLLHAIVDACK